MVFPTLSRRPLAEKNMPIDNSIRHETELNHVVRRPRGTRRRRQFQLTYDLLNSTDANALITLYNTAGTYLAFTWRDKNGNLLDVMFDTPLNWTEQFPCWFKFEQFTLTEV